MIRNWTVPGLVFLLLLSIYLTLLIFLDCKMSFCVWPTQSGRGRSGCYLGFGTCAADSSSLCIHKCEFENYVNPSATLPLSHPPSHSSLAITKPTQNAHTQNHSLFVLTEYLVVLDLFLKTGNVTQPVPRANANFPTKSHVSTNDGLQHIFVAFKKKHLIHVIWSYREKLCCCLLILLKCSDLGLLKVVLKTV